MFFIYSFKHRNEIKEAEQVSAEWGTLFYEFNNDKGLGSSQFYFYFFLRRIFYISILIFLRDWPIIQISLNFTITTAVIDIQNFFYLMTFRPFSEQILNFSNGLSELSVMLIFIFIAVSNFSISESLYSSLSMLLIKLVDTLMGVQMAASILVFIKNIYRILKIRFKNRIIPIATATTFETKTSKSKTLNNF